MKDKFKVDLGTYLVYPFLINFRFQSLNKYHNKENLFYLKNIIDYNFQFLRKKSCNINYKKIIKVIIFPKQKKNSFLKSKNDYLYQIFFKKNKQKYIVFSLIGLSDLFNLIKFIYQENLPRNYSVIHAACVVSKKNNQAIIIFGKSNVGKSTLSNLLEKKYHFTKISDDLTLLFFKKDDFFAAPIFIDHHFFFLNRKLKNRLNLLDNLKISTFIYLKKSKTNNFEEINDLKKQIIFFNNIENINNYLISKLISKKELKLIKIDFINHHFKDLIQKKIVRLL